MIVRIGGICLGLFFIYQGIMMQGSPLLGIILH